MAAGLEVAAGAAQVISLAFQVFQGCIDAYNFCHTAQRIGVEGDLLRTKLQIERYRLEEWAQCSRLNTSSPDARLNWSLVYDILEQQYTILTSAEKLQSKYGLNLQDTEVVEEEKGEERADVGLGTILRRLKPKLYSNSASSQAIAKANGPWKRMQWAAGGRETVVKVIDDLGELNTHLERLLDIPDRTWLKVGMSVLLRDTLSHTTDLAQVETLQALLRPTAGVGDASIASAARFKRIRLVLGVDQRPGETRPPQTPAIYSSMPRLKMLKEKRIKMIGAALARTRGVQLATYNNESVLVEWRHTDASKYDVLEKHMQALALLLGNVDNSFATLPCLGLTASQECCRFALVYEVPVSAAEEHRSLLILHDVIARQRRMSLHSRLGIACKLAEAVLQLHTAGWLHKSIRSDNVVFLVDSPDIAESDGLGKPYLMEASLRSDLYRHPDKRGSVATGYRKRFDLFALGCVLAELALWEDLISTFSRLTAEDWHKAIEDAERTRKDLRLPSLVDFWQNPQFIEEISHAAGRRYLEAVQLCLSNAAPVAGDDDASLDTQRKVLETLQECRV
ncbi:hypothetical protein BST61_g6846 [Cercospora zeina]